MVCIAGSVTTNETWQQLRFILTRNLVLLMTLERWVPVSATV